MSDFSAGELERIARDIVGPMLTTDAPGWTERYPAAALERKIYNALCAAEAHALAHAAELCAARAQRWHQDSSVHRELLACAAAIRGLSEPSS